MNYDTMKKAEPMALEIELQNYETHGIFIKNGDSSCGKEELMRKNNNFVRESFMRDYVFKEDGKSLSEVRFDEVKDIDDSKGNKDKK